MFRCISCIRPNQFQGYCYDEREVHFQGKKLQKFCRRNAQSTGWALNDWNCPQKSSTLCLRICLCLRSFLWTCGDGSGSVSFNIYKYWKPVGFSRACAPVPCAHPSFWLIKTPNGALRPPTPDHRFLKIQFLKAWLLSFNNKPHKLPLKTPGLSKVLIKTFPPAGSSDCKTRR